MPLDQSRIQGFGSDGSTAKRWTCPAGHMLQPAKAKAGKCDGCGKKVSKGDRVMDCRTCNWYLCEDCHPQEKPEEEDWFWGSLTYIVENVKQEITEIGDEISGMAGDFENFVSDAFVQGGCTVIDGKQLEREEIRFGDEPAGDKRSTKAKEKKRHRVSEATAVRHGVRQEAGEEDEPLNPDGAETASASAPARATAEAAAENEATANSTTAMRPLQLEQSAHPPPQDLLDIGQDDLMRFDSGPVEQAPPPAVASSSEAPAVASPPAASWPTVASSTPPLASPPPSATSGEAAHCSGIASVAASPATDLLDLDFGASAAAASVAVVDQAPADSMKDLDFGAPVATAKSVAALAPAASMVDLDFGDFTEAFSKPDAVETTSAPVAAESLPKVSLAAQLPADLLAF